jgi:SAM-dependent methyltransferase
MTDDVAAARAAGAAIFAQDDVVASYHGRQPYAPAAIAVLLAVVPGRRRVLDIGCGPGLVTRELAPHFAEVVAVDPSPGMIAAGKVAAPAANIRWVCAKAEDVDLGAGFDLAVAGSSVHWVDPAVMFPRLARTTPVFATLGNDALFPWPPPPCGMDAWLGFLETWNAKVGRKTPAAWREAPDSRPSPAAPHEIWMDVAGRERFRFTFRQSVEAFIASCHARVSWPRQMMGPDLAAAFDAALTDLLTPHAGADGLIALDILTDLAWGAPRATPHK